MSGIPPTGGSIPPLPTPPPPPPGTPADDKTQVQQSLSVPPNTSTTPGAPTNTPSTSAPATPGQDLLSDKDRADLAKEVSKLLEKSKVVQKLFKPEKINKDLEKVQAATSMILGSQLNFVMKFDKDKKQLNFECTNAPTEVAVLENAIKAAKTLRRRGGGRGRGRGRGLGRGRVAKRGGRGRGRGRAVSRAIDDSIVSAVRGRGRRGRGRRGRGGRRLSTARRVVARRGRGRGGRARRGRARRVARLSRSSSSGRSRSVRSRGSPDFD